MISDAQRATIKARIASDITANGVGAITGTVLNDLLDLIIDGILNTIHEDATAPSLDPNKRFWLDTSDTKLKAKDATQVGSPFVPVFLKIAAGSDASLTLNELTNELHLSVGGSGITVVGSADGYASHALMVTGGLVSIGQHYYVGVDGNGLNQWGLEKGLILKRFV